MSSTIVSAMAPTRTYAPAAANRDARPVPTGPKTARRRPSQDIATRIETSAIRPPRSGAYAIVRVNPTTPASTLAASTRYPTARRVIRCLVTTPRQPRANRHRAPTGPIPASSACIARPHSRRPSGSNRTAPPSSHPAASWRTTHLAAPALARRRRRGRRRGKLVGQPHPGTGQPVEVAGRPPHRRVGLPGRLQQSPVAQPDQDRVQRTGLQADLLAQFVAVPPGGRLRGQGTQYRDGLRGRASGPGHGITLST